MPNAARSVLVFGFYLAATGLGLFFVPGTLLPVLGFRPPADFWAQIAGLLTAILGMYFIVAARNNDLSFFRASVAARLIFFAGVAWLVISGAANPLLLAFGAVDLLGAAWTMVALRKASV